MIIIIISHDERGGGMYKFSINSLLMATALSTFSVANAASYTYEISDSQTWSNSGTSETSTAYVTVRAYVPGSNTINYTSAPIYTSTYSSEANLLGDIVGSTSNIYGKSPAWVDPYNGAKYSLMYPTNDVMRTRLRAVNDQRLAIGSYIQLGGRSTSFIYDLIYKQYTILNLPSGASATIVDINSIGQIIGSESTSYGVVPFIYDCMNEFQEITIPGSTSTTALRIDEQGKIYGRVHGLDDNLTYYIATPDSLPDTSSCSLVARDDVAEPIAFTASKNFEMSGDSAQLVKVGDYNHGGADDLFVYHEMGKYILYLGEGGFEEKIKNFADWNTVETVTGVTSATEWDFNNDGLIDKIDGNRLYLAKNIDEYYYVPQTLPVGSRAAYGDFNGDGLLDVASFNGGFVSFTYQTYQGAEPVVIEPAPEPVITAPEPVSSGDVPVISSDAKKVERTGTIAEVRNDSVLLSNGKVLWFNADSIIKYNDASGFEEWQTLEFKAWLNPNGNFIGIKVEVAE
jgi:hypothetical protein